MRYYIQNTPKGYVVAGYDFNVHLLLRNFGDMQSAAIEFRDYCNEHVDEQNARRFAATYKESELYTYPSIKNGRVTLRKQRTY